MGRIMGRQQGSKSHATALGTRLPRILGAAALTTLMLALGRGVYANPHGGEVVRGRASIATDPGRVTIEQHSGKAVINWNGFSIEGGEVTEFRQPGKESIALNRVVGPDSSRINGELRANGNVWLVNQNGVMVGPGGKVKAQGFLATTTDIDNDAFMDGRYNFDRPSSNPNAKVINQGRISLGQRGLGALVAPHARNDGIIEGQMSNVVVGGAETFSLDVYGDGLIEFDITGKVERRPDGVHALAENTGEIIVDGGNVLITADAAAGIIEDVVNVAGRVQARSFTDRTGAIVIDGGDQGRVRVSGELDATGAVAGSRGGSIDVRGRDLLLTGTARLDASGPAGGGDIRVGRDGRNGTRASRELVIEPGASLSADATDSGNGGSIWALAGTRADIGGRFSARGGVNGGNGGFIETSAAEVRIDPAASFSAPARHAGGVAGTWLLDPTDITVDATVAGQIVTALQGGSNVTVDTDAPASPDTVDADGNPAPTGDAGNITVTASIQPDLTTDGGVQDVLLTLNATRNIAIQAGVAIGVANSDTGDRLSVTLSAGRGADDLGGVTLAGDINLVPVAGDGTAGTVAIEADESVSLVGTLTAADATIESRFGAIDGGGLVMVQAVDLSAGDLINVISAAQAIGAESATGGITIANALAADVTVTGLRALGTGGIDFDQAGGGSLEIQAASTADGGIDIANANPGASPGAELTISGPVTADGADADIALATTGSGDIALEGTVTAEDDEIAVSAAGAIDGPTDPAHALVAQRVELDAGLGIGAATAVQTRAEALNADAVNGAIDLDNTLADAVTVEQLRSRSGDRIDFDQSGGDVTFNDVETAGTATLGADASIVVVGSGISAGTANLAAGGSLTGGVIAAGLADLDAGGEINVTTAARTMIVDSATGGIRIVNTLAEDVTVTALRALGTGGIDFDQAGGGSLEIQAASTADGGIDIANSDPTAG
ncbi:filamentous hemagglutinin N-terminal domain-containing protein, partial [Thiohalocapsa sp. ML1]|uniref:two-partner secretion domain-containing protein n=1 Tax=Thiohalocapsa sp. ML1 TaxID=1431688 RepID=UPI0012E371CB